MCELLHERMKLLLSVTECPPDLDEVVCTLMYCGDRTECPEMSEISKQLKYGLKLSCCPVPSRSARGMRLEWPAPTAALSAGSSLAPSFSSARR